MKKGIIIFCFVFLFSVVTTTYGNTLYEIFPFKSKLLLNGNEISLQNPIFIHNDRTYVPLREVADILKVDVIWDENTNNIIINTNSIENSEEWLVYCDYDTGLIQYGYMDTSGNIKIKAQYDYARVFNNGLAIVGNNIPDAEQLPSGSHITRYGVINARGEIVVPIQFISISEFNNGLAWVVEENGTEYYIDIFGNRTAQKYIGDKFFINGISPICLDKYAPQPTLNQSQGSWSYINHQGELATTELYDSAGYFENGLAIVQRDGKYGVIDLSFAFKIQCKYDDLQQISDMYFAAKNNGVWGVVTLYDDIIVPFRYFNIGKFSNGLAPVRSTMTEGAFIDLNGDICYDDQFGMVYDFVDGYACVEDKSTNKYGVIDTNGTYILEPQYEHLIPERNDIVRSYRRIDGRLVYDFIDMKTGEYITPK